MTFSIRDSTRNEHGQAMIVLLAFVALFIITALGLLAFELSRYVLAREQLKNCVDAAALAGQATLATYSPSAANNSRAECGYRDPTSAYVAQAAAVKAAFKIFCQNSVLGLPLTHAALPQGVPAPGHPPNPPPNPLPEPRPNQAVLSVEFLVPGRGANSQTEEVAGQRIIRVSGVYGVAPAFGGLLPISTTAARSSSTAAVPMTDVINCFDVSGAMDDQTKVTFVKRIWSPAGYIDYQPVYAASGLVAEGTIDQILGSPARGTNVNALPPQGLENASNAPSPLKFSEAEPTTRFLRGVTNTGSSPGNRPGQVAPPNAPPQIGGRDVFTDLVVNLDGNAHFGGATTVNGYSFPNIGVLVEAARGNLENNAVFAAAGLVGNPYFSGITPRPGYKRQGYELNAMKVISPFNNARNAALNFSYVLLHTNNCHMGEISFNDRVGVTDLSTFTAPNVSAVYPQADFPKPATFMLPNQYQEPMSDQLFFMYKELCTSSVARIWGQTSNVGASLLQVAGNERAAINWLNDPAHHRHNADRAIVLMTNSAPLESDAPAARRAATLAHSLGISIFVVGLAETASTQAAQHAIFNDVDSSPSSGGICGIAGHGSRFFQVSNQSDLPQAYGNVLRQLVKLVQ